jgi:MYXO-CTERM domain-containing protein
MPSSRAAFRTALTALSFALPFTIGALASAQSACGDGPACPENWECKTEAVPCLATPCDREGGDCEPVDCAAEAYSYCSPLPCTSDSQCDDGMVCYSETREECDSAPPCAGGDCPMTEGTCTSVTESGCVPPYVLPCEADADCGVGFTCEAEMDCQCAGSAGGGSSGSSGGSAGGSGAEPAPDEKAAADAGAGDPAPPADDSGATPDGGAPDCTCQPSDRKSCSVKIVACSVDEGCPAGWTCGDNPSGSCWASSDGSSGCTPAEPAKICVPPYADVIGGGRGVAEDSGGSGTVTGGVGETPEPPKGSDDGSGANADPLSPSADDDTGGSDSDGCAIGHTPGSWHATIGFAALALAGLFGARRRRAR